MAVIGVLREPTPPTWWQANRHKFWGICGLLIGYMIGSHYPGTDQQPQHPRPGHSTPAPTAPARTPSAPGSTA
ncbi:MULTISPECIES: hypothetical protein [unclassified Streptomyces]|uniref:hypothetical protein n=1 Tax=unclassified Streptomyces TaxID=2593676 RepID=UPI0035DBD280